MDFDTRNYKLEVGQDKDEERAVYQVVNKLTGVVEYEDFILPRTIEALLNLEDKLAEATLAYNQEEAPVLTIINKEPSEKLN